MVRENDEVEANMKWKQWRQTCAQKNIADMDEVDVGGKCVRMKQVGSSMLST